LKDRWSPVVDEIRKSVGESAYKTWFEALRFSRRSSNRVAVLAPDRATRDALRSQYQTLLRNSLRNTIGPAVEVDIIAADLLGNAPGQSFDPFLYSLNSQYTFDNFIVGPSNRLAQAAAVAVAQNPGHAYNPLFVHSNVGLGKTHLVQAACHELLTRNPAAKLRYLSCESFVNDFIHAVERGELAGFRAAYRQLDMLVIDDVQFLSKKERTQEEFFHTFNTLYNAGKQIVLTNDSRPADLSDLEERLVSRFKWGLVVPIDSPVYETRVAIIHRKAKLRGAYIPEPVVDYVAHNVDTNIREIEGAIIKLSAYAALTSRPIDMTLAQEALGIRAEPQRQISMADILSVITTRFSVKLADLQSKKRTQAIVLPRQLCMYVARRLTSHSLEEIGGFFGGRDHTTVLYANQKIGADIKKDCRLAATVEEILRNLGAP